MLFGATGGFIAAQTTDSYLIGFLVGIIIGGLLGLLHGFVSITLGVDQVLSGMGIWILGFGLTTYIGNPYTGPLGLDRIPTIAGNFSFLLSRNHTGCYYMVCAFQDKLRIENQICGRESIGRRSLRCQCNQNTLYECYDWRYAYGFCWRNLFPGIQPCLELQLYHGLGFYCSCARLFFDVESTHLLAGALHNPRGWGVRLYGTGTIVLAGLGAAVAARQVWIQHLPPEQLGACGADLDYMLQNFPLVKTVTRLWAGTTDCATVTWSFLGISMAGWMVVCFTGFVVLGAWLLLFARTPGRG